MIKRIIIYTIFSAIIIFLAVISGTAEEAVDPIEMLYKSRELMSNVDGYTATLMKEEVLDKKMRPQETIAVKFKKPFMVYMKWIKDPHKGRELLYVKERNNGNMKVHIGGLLNLILPTINIDPENPRVKKNTRHPVTRAGLANLTESLIEQFELAKSRNQLEVTFLGSEMIDDMDTYKFERKLPKDQGYYCYRLIINIEKERSIPVRVEVYDWDDKLVERYTYIAINLNAPLTEEDFNPRNRDYGFGIF